MTIRRMYALKSLAMNCGPLSEMIRGWAPGKRSLARCRMISVEGHLETGVGNEDRRHVPTRRLKRCGVD